MIIKKPIYRSYSEPGIDKSRLLSTVKDMIDSGHLIAGVSQTNQDHPSSDHLNFRGDLTGCLTLAINHISGEHEMSPYLGNHHFVSRHLGFPVELVTVANLIFEELPDEKGPKWALKLLKTIPESTNLASGLAQVIKRILSEIALPSIHKENQDAIEITKKAIDELYSGLETSTPYDACKLWGRSHWEARNAMETLQNNAKKLRATSHALLAVSRAFNPEYIKDVLIHAAMAAEDAGKPNGYRKMAKIMLDETKRLIPRHELSKPIHKSV